MAIGEEQPKRTQAVEIGEAGADPGKLLRGASMIRLEAKVSGAVVNRGAKRRSNPREALKKYFTIIFQLSIDGLS